MPIALRYSGAHTHGFSGDWKLNQQNLPSRKGRKLRQSLRAPEGHVILASDASQIEARLTAWLAGQEDLVAAFAAGDDVYSLFASKLYGRKVTKKDKVERFLGKTSILGLGFGMGANKFQNTVRIAAADQGIEMDLDALGGASAVVSTYRDTYPQIPTCWRRLERVLSTMTEPHGEQREMFGPCLIRHESLVLPTGLRLNYHDLRYEDGPGWSYWNGRMRKSIWGGTLLENVVQALDRVVVIDAALRIEARMRHLGLHMPLAHQMHDELVYVPREQDVDVARAIVDEEMARRPVWGLDLPLASESKAGWTFGDMG
jgi:DNA polymerase